MKKEILRFERVTQIEENLLILDDFNINIFEGEVMGLLCINSAGKDVFFNLTRKNTPIHKGFIYFNEKLVNQFLFSSMRNNKVYFLDRQSQLVNDLTVSDNIFVLKPNMKKYLISEKMLNKQFDSYIKETNFYIDGSKLITELSFYEKCAVEIIKAVLNGYRLIILNDLTGVMGTPDLKKFHSLINYYKALGISFIYHCSHHEDAFNICDRAALMEDGHISKILSKDEFSDEVMNHFIVDFTRHKTPIYDKNQGNNSFFKFKNVSFGKIKDLNFYLNKGECSVFIHKSSTELRDMLSLFSDKNPEIGSIEINKKPIKKNPSEDILIINENPLKTMLFDDMSYMENLCFLLNEKIYPKFLTRSMKKSIINEYGNILGDDIHAKDIRDISTVSLYKLIYYKVILYKPRLAVLVQPFRGVDMYTRDSIAALIYQILKRKISVLILAINISDTLSVADKLFVMEKGTLSKVYNREDFKYFQGKERNDTLFGEKYTQNKNLQK